MAFAATTITTTTTSVANFAVRRTSSSHASGRRVLSSAGRATRSVVAMGKCNVELPAVDFKAEHADLPKLGKDVWNDTYYPTLEDTKEHKEWLLIDAEDQILGRLASDAAQWLRGKKYPEYTPSMDMGANVIIINAEKVRVTGNKADQKLYRRHSGRPGGMKVENFNDLQQRIPERIVEKAIKGMLPKGRLGRKLFTNLKVYKGAEHPHSAQQPRAVELGQPCEFPGAPEWVKKA